MDKDIKNNTAGKKYTLFVDGEEYQAEKPELTGEEILNIGECPLGGGVVILEEDGTRTCLEDDEVINIAVGVRFKKVPRFVVGGQRDLRSGEGREKY